MSQLVVGPGAATTSSGTWDSVAPESCRRVELLLFAALAGLLVGTAVLPLVTSNTGALAGFERPFWLIPAALGLTVATLAVVRRSSLPVTLRVDVGLGYVVLMCGMVSVFAHSLPYTPSDVVRGPSGVALAILVVSAVVPLPPQRLAATLVLTALMDPAGLFVTLVGGNPSPRPTFWLWLFLPTVACAAIGWPVARQLYSLRRELQAARRLGSYRLLEKLGEGGMGEVWRAEHHTLARPAALKLIRLDRMADQPEQVELARKRFEREARATATLQSPHTIEVYDYGTADDGTFYYVMELLDGLDLQALVERDGPLPPERAVHLLLQACRSLAEAHDQGLVHRDIKPANLYVCRRADEVDVVKVLDFGLVKQQPDASEPVTELTQANAVSGTPAYLSPEQAMARDVDGRSDIYSLGCVAWYLLTGKTVFTKGSVVAVLIAHVNEVAPSMPDSVPSELAAVVQRCLAKSPADRPGDCRELAGALAATGLAAAWTTERALEAWAPPSQTAEAAHPDALAAPTQEASHRNVAGLMDTLPQEAGLIDTLPSRGDVDPVD